jgi:peptidoglycan hydrolase-like protein with peptidoglycan-binding domain
MSRAWLSMTFCGALAAVGCGHTHAATDVPAPAANAEPASPPSDQVAESPRPAKRRAPAPPGTPPLFASPEAALAPEGVDRIQEKLVSGGELEENEASGHLDDATKRALAAFQKKHNVPATGIPDDTTVRKLGLDPGAIFRKASE